MSNIELSATFKSLVLEKPFDEINGNETYAIPGPVPDQPYQTFCGT